MGIFDRISRLVRANVNDALDNAEDPEKMLDQLIRDMAEEIRQARGQVAAMIAQEKELAADKAEAERMSAEWQRRAELAVAQSKDDLAREALRRKRDSDENARIYGEQLAAQQQTVSRLKNQLQELEAKHDQMESKRDALVARSRRAKAQQQVAETMGNLPTSDSAAEFERFLAVLGLRRLERHVLQQLPRDLTNDFAVVHDQAMFHLSILEPESLQHRSAMPSRRRIGRSACPASTLSWNG